MQTKVFVYPDKRFYTLEKLQERLSFSYLVKNRFATPKERLSVQRKGMRRLKKGEIPSEATSLGSHFADKIEGSYQPNISIHFINERVGYGLFVEEPLEKGAFAGEYTGFVRKNDQRYGAPINNYCYRYPIPDSLGRDFVIDATEGNFTRFINHSYQPNLKPHYAFLKGFYHVIFLAERPIQKGAQLFFNYGKSYWYVRGAPDLFIEKSKVPPSVER